jgi:hypothetical protein
VPASSSQFLHIFFVGTFVIVSLAMFPSCFGVHPYHKELHVNKTISLLAFFSVLLIASLACAGSTTPTPASLSPTDTAAPTLHRPTETPTPTLTGPAETPTPALDPRCVPASAAQVDIIRLGVQGVQESNNIKSVWAVRSDDFERVWFVAAEITGPGIEPKQAIGLWAIPGELDVPSAGAWSVNPFALEFSDWADGPGSDAQLSEFDDGAQEALSCASAAP